MHDADANSALRSLLVEILTMISENNRTVTHSEAEEYRVILMVERMASVDESIQGYFEMVLTSIHPVFTMKLILSPRSSRSSVSGGFLIFGLFRNVLTRTAHS